ncbi:MAG: branched-chain amino acid transport system II carrier protein [Firmicutes bacterium]|nr:branched-chain amino acid transport system II carrier protein [Bacillota bacterium]
MIKDVNKKGDLRPLALFLSGGALFSMHFGASSMVWPMNWGKESGSSLPAAFAGAFITALLLVVMGYIALARSGKTYTVLSKEIGGRRFGLYFACLTILVNGPLYVIPRMSAAAWDSAVQAFGIGTQSRLPLIAFTLVFYAISYALLISPGKVMDRISSILFPLLIVIVAAVVIAGLTRPLGEIQPKAYSGSAFAYGFTGGYATGEVLCAMIFGAVILNSLRDKGVEGDRLTKNMIYVGLCGIGILTLTHFCHMVIGAKAAALFPGLSYTALYTAVAAELFGKAGGMLFCAALFMAALTTSIGMTSGCAEFFAEASGGRPGYRQWALAISLLSVVFGSLGLAGILSWLGPVLDGVYPPVIIMVLYYSLAGDITGPRSQTEGLAASCSQSEGLTASCSQIEAQSSLRSSAVDLAEPRSLAGGRLAFLAAFIFGMTDMAWKYLVKFDALPALCRAYLRLPLASVSLAWVPWAALAFALGRLIGGKKKQQP